MSEINRALTILLFLSFALTDFAQDLEELFFPVKSNIYIGQLGSNRKEYNGFGVLNLKSKGIYFGDFSRGKFHGLGLQIAKNGKTIDNCGEGKIYVGKWFRGKKHGKGKLYNEAGALIYNGVFESDYPVDSFINDSDTTIRFNFTSVKDEIYCGETTLGIPNGFGIFCDNENFITICPVVNGIKKGVGIMIYPPKNWYVFNIDDEIFYPIESFSDQTERFNHYAIRRQEENFAMLNTFTQILSDVISIGNDLSYSHEETSSYSIQEQSEGGSSLPLQYSNWAKRAESNYNSLTNLGTRKKKNGKDEGGSNGQSLSPSGYVQQKKALREAQAEMRRIRQKAQKLGIAIEKSEYEDIQVKY